MNQKPLDSYRVYLVGGAGGVGKTTLAASIGIRLALQGKISVVLTVDPARRLAQALGLESFHNQLQKVDLPPSDRGELFASQLDSVLYLDSVIARFTKSPEQKDKILKNPIYRSMVDSLGGTHEYAAMERLLEFAEGGRFEKIVVDTPPTQNAVELLNAPKRLADFMDTSVLRWFQGSSPGYLSLFRQGTRLAMKLLQRIFGTEFLGAFSKFIDDLEGMQAGFRSRHLQVLELLRSDESAFVLVTLPTEVRYHESVQFSQTLREFRIPLRAVILNRLDPPVPHENVDALIHPSARHALSSLVAYENAFYVQQQKWVARFQDTFSDIPFYLIPREEKGLHEVMPLSQLGISLIS